MPIVQYWHENEVPDYIEEILASFREHNPKRRHLVFDESSAQGFIEEHFSSREVEAFRACAVPAMQADYFRYCAILALGGVYCDVDVRCLASLEPILPAAGEGQLFIRPEGAVVNGLFAFGSPGHPFLGLALEIVTANIERRRCDRVYFTTGPPIFTCLHWLHRLGTLEALVARAAGTGFEDHFRAYGQTIGDFARLGDAYEGVRVSPLAESSSLVGPVESPLPYKVTNSHWTNVGTSIFRDRSARGG